MVKSAHTRKNSTFAIRKCATFSIRTIFIYNHTHTCYALISKKIDEKEEDILSIVNSVWCNGKNDIMWYLGVVFISSQYSLTHYFFLSSFFWWELIRKTEHADGLRARITANRLDYIRPFSILCCCCGGFFTTFMTLQAMSFGFFLSLSPPFVGYYL